MSRMYPCYTASRLICAKIREKWENRGRGDIIDSKVSQSAPTSASFETCQLSQFSVSAGNLNCTDNYNVAKIKVKSVTDHQ